MTVPRNASGWSQAWANSGPPQEYINKYFSPFAIIIARRGEGGVPSH